MVLRMVFQANAARLLVMWTWLRDRVQEEASVDPTVQRFSMEDSEAPSWL